jgi:hypothetical protein
VSRLILVCPECDLPFQTRVEIRPALDPNWKRCAQCNARVDITKLVERTDMNIASWVGGGFVPPDVIPLGKANGVSTGAAATLVPYLSVGKGSTLVVCMTTDAINGDPDSLSFAGTALTQRATTSVGLSGGIYVYSLANVAVGPGALTINAATATNIPEWAITLYEIDNATSNPFDKKANAAGTSTTPSSGATVATSQAKETVIGCVAWNTSSISGNWSGGFVAGQSSLGANFSIEDALLRVTATGAQTAAKTGAANVAWGAIVATFRTA